MSDGSPGDEPLHPDEAHCIAHAAPARRRDFAAGRSCARRALAALGVPRAPLLPGPGRAPQWPSGVVGSITHCKGFCGVAAARVGQVRSLGLDAETAAPLDEDLVAEICTPEERDALDALPAGPIDWPKLLFSAKESTYKCYYPLGGAILEFSDVAITLAPGAGEFAARLTREETPSAGGARAFRGRFHVDPQRVYTAVTLLASEVRE